MTIQSLTTFSKLQTTAATLTSLAGIVPRAGIITKIYAAQGTVATEADETMTITITAGSGDTAVCAAFVLDSGNSNDVAEAGVIVTTGAAHVAAGDVLKTVLAYSAGTGPVPQLDTIVTIEVTH